MPVAKGHQFMFEITDRANNEGNKDQVDQDAKDDRQKQGQRQVSGEPNTHRQ